MKSPIMPRLLGRRTFRQIIYLFRYAAGWAKPVVPRRDRWREGMAAAAALGKAAISAI